MRKMTAALVVIVLLAAATAAYFFLLRPTAKVPESEARVFTEPVPVAAAEPPPAAMPAPVPAEPVIAHPVESEPSPQALPELDQSDAPMLNALAAALGKGGGVVSCARAIDPQDRGDGRQPSA